MAQVRCPNCGKANPDLLDVCQFCQTPLKSDSVLQSGEKPTKKNTGELEPILPDWLKDVRQQARDAAEQEAAEAAAQPKPSKHEPPDLLAGLASQAGRGAEEDVPDWLASLNPTAKPKATTPSTTEPESGTDFFAQFNKNESKPEPVSKPQTDVPPQMPGQTPAPAEKDELSEWLNQASGRADETVESDEGQSAAPWAGSFDLSSTGADESPSKEDEDLSWLHNLEAAAKQTGELEPPRHETDWKADFETPSPSAPFSTSQDDLSWLDRLGGIEEPSQQAPEQPAAAQPQDDLSWLNQFGGISESQQPSQPAAPQEDLSWLDNLGAPSSPQPVDAAPDQPIPPQPFAAEEDLDWLNKLGGPTEPAQPAMTSSAEDLSWLNDLGKPSQTSEPTAQEDLSWLNAFGEEPGSAAAPPLAEEDASAQKVSPRQTAPLNKQAQEEEEPDWLRKAIQGPSMPAPGDLSLDWFSGSGQPPSEKTPPPTPKTAPFEGDIFSTPSEQPALSNQDVDSLFSVEMPDWLSSPEPGTAEHASAETGTLSMEGDESLAPVDLPSWVQAMRPVEAVISETASHAADQPAETEGPLAGLRGVIPIAPIGSARRPKAVSLTLQASEEQQASALLLEEILGSETSPRALVASSVVTSQRWLRWALAGLLLFVLTAMLFLRSQMMPVSAGLPEAVGGLSNAVMGIPANGRVLVVVDYEPSLAGEMEAISGPLLDQIALLSRPNLSFVSTSPSGVALVERLMTDINVNQPGVPHLNLGYLPGGSAGVLGFMQAPGQIIPTAGVQSFSEYAALVVLTDHAESGRVWVEQLQNRKQADPVLSNQPLLMVASAQAGPLLQPYVSSGQITGMISGLPDAARYGLANNGRPGMTRSYWDTFGTGLMLSVALMIVGSLWSLFTGLRTRRANVEQG